MDPEPTKTEPTTEPAAGPTATATATKEAPKPTEPAKETPPAAEPKAADPSPKETPKAPDKYEFTVPDGSALEQADVERISALARERNLSNDDGQKLLESHNETVQQVIDRNMETLKQRDDAWAKELAEDPEFGGQNLKENAETFKRGLQQFFPEDFAKEISDVGYGNYPKFVKPMTAIFKKLGVMSDKLVDPGARPASPKPKSAAETMFPLDDLQPKPSSGGE